MRIRGYDNLSILYEIESAVVLALLCKNRNRAGSSTTYFSTAKGVPSSPKSVKIPNSATFHRDFAFILICKRYQFDMARNAD